MNEKLLQYLWNFKIFKSFDFADTEGNSLEILNFGIWNHDSGPDFLQGKIKTNNIVLAGNIELHSRSSDWVFHQHSNQAEYDNVILHVVYQHDVELEDLKKKNIPTLELRNYIDEEVLWKYEQLSKNSQFIPCEKIFDKNKIPFGFFEETLLRKLDEKSVQISEDLKRNKNNYEAVLFHLLSYAFGLKVNAPIFKQIAESMDFNIIQKVRRNQTQLEALLFGIAGWLQNPQDEAMSIWEREFNFLKSKYNLPDIQIKPKFLRLRPPNFPTIRLSQLASLYHHEQNLFSKVISAKYIEEIKNIFRDIKASKYWDNHFNFGKNSDANYKKVLSEDFINIIFINAILPLKFTYHKNTDEHTADTILDFYRNLSPEKNNILEGWKNLDVKINNALESQALIYHYKNFCEHKNCLNCSIGFKILKKT